MAASLDDSALDGIAAAIDKLLERPDTLLDPSGAEAKDIAKGARSFAKLFFDQAQARCPPKILELSDGLSSLVVDGFEPEQIWEQLEVQNVPLRRHLRHSVKKFTSAPKGAIDFSMPVAGASDIAGTTPAAASSKKAAPEEPPRGKKVKRKAAAKAPSDEEAEADASSSAEADDAAAEEGEVEAEAEEKTEGDEPLEDGFFSLSEMNRFADLAEAPGKGMRLDDDAEDSDDFGMLEGEDEMDDEDGEKDGKATFADFFDKPSEKPGGREGGKAGAKALESRADRRAKAMEAMPDSDEDEEEEEEIGGVEDEEELSDEERQLENKIKELQAEDGGSTEDDEEAEEEAASNKDADEEMEEKMAGPENAEPDVRREAKSLYEMDKRLRGLEEEVAKLEEEQLEDKHWSLRGEVTAKHRPLNSLLEVHLDQPMTQLAGSRAGDAGDAAGVGENGEEGALDDVAGGDSMPKAKGFDIEALIQQRVWDETYDDVVRKAELPPSQRPHKSEEDALESLNFEKSRVGLGAVYEKQYETEMMGKATDAEVKEDKEKTETKAMFAKLMYKLDILTNAHFTPRPPTIAATGEQLKKVASLKMEETIPLMMSDALLKAPEEVRAPRRHGKEREELSREERKAARGNKKAGRKKKLEQKVEAGQLSLAGMRERSEKLQEKNKDAKLEKAKVGQVKDAKKRLRSSDLLSQAAANASSGNTRKDVARQERHARAESGLDSKKLKL